MNVPNSVCMYLYAGLLVGIWLVLFVRAYARRRLVKKIAPFFLQSDVGAEWEATHRRFWGLFGEARRMGIVQRRLNIVPSDLLRDHRRFILLTRAAYILVVALILFGFLAYKFCE